MSQSNLFLKSGLRVAKVICPHVLYCICNFHKKLTKSTDDHLPAMKGEIQRCMKLLRCSDFCEICDLNKSRKLASFRAAAYSMLPGNLKMIKFFNQKIPVHVQSVFKSEGVKL